jgi:hypothetical protein
MADENRPLAEVTLRRLTGSDMLPGVPVVVERVISISVDAAVPLSSVGIGDLLPGVPIVAERTISIAVDGTASPPPEEELLVETHVTSIVVHI